MPRANLEFSVQVFFEGVRNLYPPYLLAQTADLLAQSQGSAIGKADERATRLGVDLGHLEALRVVRPFVGQHEQVGALFYGDRLLLRPRRRPHVDAELRLDALFVINLLDTHEGVVGRILGCGACHHDVFDQIQFKGAHRIEAVDEVVGIAVGGRVAQRAERVHGLDRLLRPLGGVHALRLVDDHDRARRLRKLDRRAAGKPVALLVNDIALAFFVGAGEVLAEGVDVDDHDLERIACGELTQPIHLLCIVDKVLEGKIVIEHAEVLGGDFDVLEHPFADGHARHHDRELLEAVAA